MADRFVGKSVLVTGAASGNGRAIALKFAEEGAAVTVVDIQKEPRMGGSPTHERIKKMGQETQFVECDVSNQSEIRAAVDTHVEKFGSLDVMVNNAGVDRQKPIDNVSVEDYNFLMDVNQKGVFFGCQAAVEEMTDQEGGGSIINMSSVAGLIGLDNSSLYCTSKGGVTNLTRQLAVEQGENGIRVNALNPGLIKTAMHAEDAETTDDILEQTPLGRGGEPEEVANAAVFLASEDASFITGHNLVIDGGFSV